MNRVLDQLIHNLRSAAKYNSDIQVAPTCILWPDKERQWEAVISKIQTEAPELYVLGEYEPERKMGPGVWLRCVIANKIPGHSIEEGKIPVIYLPGIGRQDLRAIESCSDLLKPIVELQYRGVIWSQHNGKDWTVLSFLVATEAGLSLKVAQDNETKTSILIALSKLLEEDVSLLQEKPLDKTFFNTLLTGTDWVKNILMWINRGESYKNALSPEEWTAFVKVSISNLGFNPEKEGLLEGAKRFASKIGPWSAVWERFCESPGRYSEIPVLLRKANMPKLELFSNWETHGGWPQWNDSQEAILREALNTVASSPEHEVKKVLLALEQEHSPRRKLVWNELGLTPLANALEHLATMINNISNVNHIQSLEELATVYQTTLYKIDASLLQGLASCEHNDDFNAVAIAIRSFYLSWADTAARHLQNLITKNGYPYKRSEVASCQDADSTCVLFVDGLRFDLGKQLSEKLFKKGFHVQEKLTWAALPSVTPTGKTAVAPIANKFIGLEDSLDFEPSILETKQSMKGGYHFKKLLEEAGYRVLSLSDMGDGHGKAWFDFGDIDSEGHNSGVKLVFQLNKMLDDIVQKVSSLKNAGWKNIRVVTDHGWLLLPSGLPKVDLPTAVAENKWSRCASIKPGSAVDQDLYPWFWNPTVSFVLGRGISCFKNNVEYSHGGISFQECLTLHLSIGEKTLSGTTEKLVISDIVWKGMRCTVVLEDTDLKAFLDIRKEPDNSATSMVLATKSFDKSGRASVVIDGDDVEGEKVQVVVISENGQILVQKSSVIGGGE